MKEFWKDLRGYKGVYQVSNLGRVKSLSRKIKITNGFRFTKNIILSQKTNKSGYKEVNLSKNGSSKSFYVHRLVIECFDKVIPNGLCVNHIDGDKSNNNISNLEIVTHSQNMKHAFDKGLSTPPSNKMFTNDQITCIRRLNSIGFSDYDISVKFDCDKSTINRIINYKTYKNVSL